ncbi:unnamed protein product, partial [Polarella glacialis]
MLLYLWVRPDVYVESLGVLEIHAAQAFSLSCDPKVVLLSIPSGRCTSYGANSGLEIQDWHTVLEFQLNKGDFLLPNNEYELAISARSPTDLPSGSSTSWGVLLRNRLREVLQANMELPSYNLTSYGMTVLSIQPSTNVPYARNQVRMLLSFSHQLTLESISEAQMRQGGRQTAHARPMKTSAKGISRHRSAAPAPKRPRRAFAVGGDEGDAPSLFQVDAVVEGVPPADDVVLPATPPGQVEPEAPLLKVEQPSSFSALGEQQLQVASAVLTQLPLPAPVP